MKTMHAPERVEVFLEPDEDGVPFVSALKFRGATWRTRVTLEVWTYWGDWWLDPGLEGESRVYHVLGTHRGRITVFHRESSRLGETGWFVEGWFD